MIIILFVRSVIPLATDFIWKMLAISLCTKRMICKCAAQIHIKKAVSNARFRQHAYSTHSLTHPRMNK